jgi:D-sedoheptulose 7-phosphate isomerase
MNNLDRWLNSYVETQKRALDSIPVDALDRLIKIFEKAMEEDRSIFAFGNGGSGANASHFATDLGKGASDAIGRSLKVMSLNDNSSWISAIANDYSYEDVFWRQLKNYAKPGDIALAMSVSGNSPNVVKAIEWSRDHGLRTIALVGGARGRLAELAEEVIVVDSRHYGQVEDVHMNICHMLCYAFMENAKP